MSDCHGPSRSQPGQAFRIGTQEYAQAVLRTFMLLSVAGQCPTTKYKRARILIRALFCMGLRQGLRVNAGLRGGSDGQAGVASAVRVV